MDKDNKQLMIEFDVQCDNQSDSEDLTNINSSNIIVYARDWTIETIYSQISLGNIDLNPKFQRRNAWTDEKRSKLIESIIMGYPVPEIVLAENPEKKRSFIVIDGKQRLLTLAGFINNQKYSYWDKDKLSSLKVCNKLNGTSYDRLDDDTKREFENSSLRCTVITGFSDTQVLYDIFYRLNSGSVSLSTQELRQSLIRGEFADYLIDITNSLQPIHKVMNLDGPDKRLRDIETLLRVFSFGLYPNEYKGNLKRFLDDKMNAININWNEIELKIKQLYCKINLAIELLKEIFGDYTCIGRKFENGSFLSRFNKVIFEVELFYFMHLDRTILKDKDKFIENYKELCSNDSDFRDSIERSTKNLEYYKIRYSKFQELINNSFEKPLFINPF